MFLLKIFLLASIGALIGWMTNILAIKLIFRPLKPIVIPVLNFNIQGLIPKRKKEIAKSIGEVIEEELLSIREIIDKVVHEENLTEAKLIIKERINKIVKEKIPSIVPKTFKNMIYTYIDEIIEKEGNELFTHLAENMIDKAAEEVRLSKIVEEKINSFELDRIERIIISVTKKELKHIEILGGILGFIIGVIQGIIANII